MLLSIFGYPFPQTTEFSIDQELRNFQDRESRPAAMIQLGDHSGELEWLLQDISPGVFRLNVGCWEQPR